MQRAEAAYDSAANDPEVRTYASRELQEAEAALDRAQRAERRDDEEEEVDHLAYVAQRRVEIAEVSADRKHDAATSGRRSTPISTPRSSSSIPSRPTAAS